MLALRVPICCCCRVLLFDDQLLVVYKLLQVNCSWLLPSCYLYQPVGSKVFTPVLNERIFYNICSFFWNLLLLAKSMFPGPSWWERVFCVLKPRHLDQLYQRGQTEVRWGNKKPTLGLLWRISLKAWHSTWPSSLWHTFYGNFFICFNNCKILVFSSYCCVFWHKSRELGYALQHLL